MTCTCCYKCEKRCVNCHSVCKDYQEFLKKNEEDKKKRYAENAINCYVHENKEKVLKEMRRRGIKR